MSEATVVVLEVGRKKVFASAVDWPGWCRAGRDEQRALEALAEYAPRYAVAAAEAGVPLPPGAADDFVVLERTPGGATTDFGAPEKVAEHDRRPQTAEEGRRMAALVKAGWAVFDRVAADAPPALRKGPRGGGRDTDQVVAHVDGAEEVYARKLGIRRPASVREAIAEALAQPSDGQPLVERGWPPRYAARRIAWHVLDHAWEIEDKS